MIKEEDQAQKYQFTPKIKHKDKTQILIVLAYIVEKHHQFPEILFHLTFVQQKSLIKVYKSEWLLNALYQDYDIDEIMKETQGKQLYQEQIIIKRILQQVAENPCTLPQEKIKNNVYFKRFYYKLTDFLNEKIKCNKEPKYLIEMKNLIDQILDSYQHLDMLTLDYRSFIYYKAQIIAIQYTLSYNIPILSLLKITRFVVDSKTSNFSVQFDISQSIFEEIYIHKKLSLFNHSIDIDILVKGVEKMNFSQMYNYIHKIFPLYDDFVKETNLSLFMRAFNIINHHITDYLFDLIKIVQDKGFIRLVIQLSNYEHIPILNDLLSKLDKIYQYCLYYQKNTQIYQFPMIQNFGGTIQKNFTKTHIKKELQINKKVESVLMINKVFTVMIFKKIPFPLILSYLQLNPESDYDFLQITKELIIECQSNKVFNLYLSYIHYQLKQISRFENYSYPFYQQQIKKQELGQSDIIIGMLQLILENFYYLRIEIEKYWQEGRVVEQILEYLDYQTNPKFKKFPNFSQVLSLLFQLQKKLQNQILCTQQETEKKQFIDQSFLEMQWLVDKECQKIPYISKEQHQQLIKQNNNEQIMNKCIIIQNRFNRQGRKFMSKQDHIEKQKEDNNNKNQKINISQNY